MELSTLNKAQLRAACKQAGISYGKLDNAGMRAALAALGNGDVKPEVKAEDTVVDTGDKPARKRAARKTPVSDKPSVRLWLSSRVHQYGSVKLDDAKAYVAETGRSTVTMYRQAQEAGLKIDREKKAFVKA